MFQSNNPSRSQLRDNHQRRRRLQLARPVSLDPQPPLPPHPRLQQQDVTARSPILEEIAAEVEAARWRTLAHQYVAVADQHDFIGSETRQIAFLTAISGGDDDTADLIARHIYAEIDRNPELYTWRQVVWRNPGGEDGHPNPPPPYTEHPTKGEITAEVSLEVVLPEYTPPYTPFGQDPKWKTEEEDEEDKGEVWDDEEDDEDKGKVVEDDEEKREGFLIFLAFALLVSVLLAAVLLASVLLAFELPVDFISLRIILFLAY
ncbi:hypothetical protein N0V85_008872 [Neurospora sp. IMI 360204]|nr:hypothetical protein N0V85_008872 [Neurospora sp. IMI 360204]